MSDTALYRHFDGAGRLLYVGISLDPIRRTAAHMSRAHWSALIVTITIERHPSRGAAVDAEERAITAERPLYNLSRPIEPEQEIDEAAEMDKLERSLGKHPSATCRCRECAASRVEVEP